MDQPPGKVDDGAERRSLPREEIVERLREVALFQGLGDADLDEILRISEPVGVSGGSFVFEEEDRGDHFYIIVQGGIELQKRSGEETRKLAVLRAGQAFGEMALLNQTPRSASAYAIEDTYMLSVSREAFARILGGDGLAVRLLKNLSRALWATAVRLASQQTPAAKDDDGLETLEEFNRLLRARLLPRLTPRVSGYDIAATTIAPKRGTGSTSWDWFVLADGRPAFCVAKALQGDVFSAQRLAATRLVLRAAAAEARGPLGPLFDRVGRALRAGWIEGLSGPVMVGLVALADGAAEFATAGGVTGLAAWSGGRVEGLAAEAPALGVETDRPYRSRSLALRPGDRLFWVTGRHDRTAEVLDGILARNPTTQAKPLLQELLATLSPLPEDGEDASDVTATVVSRTPFR